MFERLEALKDIHEAALKQLRTDGEAALKAAFCDFFAKHPSVSSIQWTQYTPYFNDGDACVFSANEPQLMLGENDYIDSQRLADGEDAELYTDFIQLTDILQSDAMRSVLLGVFDDHSEITVTRDGITVDSYSHD